MRYHQQERASQLSPVVVLPLLPGEPLQCSTGLFFDSLIHRFADSPHAKPTMITIDPPSSPPTHKSTSASSPARLPAPSLHPSSLSKAGLTRFFNRARHAVGLRGEVEVLLTSDAELKRLNRSFRGKNKATDVLSFPAFVPDGFPAQSDMAGDLAISLETAARQAAAFGHSLRDEVRILLLHGLLHLSGLDHETDNGEMAAREAELRRGLRLPNGLIARTEQNQQRTRPAKSTPRKPAQAAAQKQPVAKKSTASKRPTGKATSGRPAPRKLSRRSRP
jgi:probable rRNA maturation factor